MRTHFYSVATEVPHATVLFVPAPHAGTLTTSGSNGTPPLHCDVCSFFSCQLRVRNLIVPTFGGLFSNLYALGVSNYVPRVQVQCSAPAIVQILEIFFLNNDRLLNDSCI